MPGIIPHGVVSYEDEILRKNDYLYRVTVKGFIRNQKGEVLVVKEANRDFWDLPGGGMDHGEDIKTALARELREEVNLQGDFNYQLLTVDEPRYLERWNIWFLRLIFEIKPDNMSFSVSEDSDEVCFIDSANFKDSSHHIESKIYDYDQMPRSSFFQ